MNMFYTMILGAALIWVLFSLVFRFGYRVLLPKVDAVVEDVVCGIKTEDKKLLCSVVMNVSGSKVERGALVAGDGGMRQLLAMKGDVVSCYGFLRSPVFYVDCDLLLPNVGVSVFVLFVLAIVFVSAIGVELYGVNIIDELLSVVD